MKFTIYSKDGSVVRYSGYPKYVGTYLGVPYLEFASIESPTPINWEKGDFIIYARTKQTYWLHSIPQPKKQARSGEYGAAFVYSNVKFYSEVKDLETTLFRDVVSEDNAVHFSTRADVSTFENVYGIATRIQENLDDLLPGKWKIEVVATDNEKLKALLNEAKEFSVSNGNCLDALTQIYEVWQNVGWTYSWKEGKHTITIGSTYFRTEDNTTSSYGYGKGQGLTSLKKATSNEEDFATRLYVYGSERNIQTRYYNNFDIHNKDSVNIVNLMIPLDKWGKTDGLPDARKAYIQADDATIAKYGIIPKIVYFDGSENDEIYPSINGLTYSEVRKAIQDSGESVGVYLPDDIDTRIDLVYGVNNPTDGGTKVDVEKNRTFSIGLESHIGFNIAEQGKLTSEGVAVIAMKTGMCAGREFRVKNQIYAPNNGAILELERAWDESLGMGFPNKTYPISKGDQFVLLDIPMPEFYITIAQNKLYEAGQRLLERNSKLIPFYEPSIDTIVAIKDDKSLREGMYMQIQDNDIIESEDNKAYVLIDSITIDEKGELPSYKVTLREQKRVAMSLGTLQGEIKDAKKDVEENSEKQARRVMFAASEVSTSVNNIINLLSSMWTLEGDTIVAKRDVIIKGNLVVEGDTSSGGEGEDTPSAGIYGIRVNGTLHEDDNNDGIIDLGIIEGGGDIDIDLSDYVTRQELENNDFATQSFVTSEIAKIDLSPYAKTNEVDAKIAALKIGDYAKKSEVYTKEQTYNREHIDGEFEEYENALATKALKSEVYTKEETYDRTHIDSEFEDVENALAVRALKSEVYTKEQTYTQTEVDTKIDDVNKKTNASILTINGAIDALKGIDADLTARLATEENVTKTYADWWSKLKAHLSVDANGNVVIDSNLIVEGDTSSGGSGGGGGTTGGGGMTDEEKDAYALKEWVTNGFNPRITSSNKLDVSLIYGLGALATKDSLSYSDVGVTKSVITSLIGTTTYAPYNANGYLPKSGGTITGALAINPSNGGSSFYMFNADDTYRLTHIWDGNTARLYNIKNDGSGYGILNLQGTIQIGGNTAIHTGNYASEIGDYYLKSTGGTISGLLTIDRDVPVIRFRNAEGVRLGSLGFSDVNSPIYATNGGRQYTLLHSGNYATEIGDYYLKSSGGILQGDSADLLVINRLSNTSSAYITFKGNNSLRGRIGFDANNNPIVQDINYGSGNHTLIHSGNIGEYKAGDSDKLGGVSETEYARYSTNIYTKYHRYIGYGTTTGGFPQNGGAVVAGITNYSMLLHGRNGVFRFNTMENGSLTGWKTVAFTDSNVASATKLQTARTIWGQSFDGTGNVSGSLGGVNLIRYSSTKDYGVYLRGALFSSSLTDDDIVIYAKKTFLGGGGNVGIGITDPQYKLDVNGTARVSGATTLSSTLEVGGIVTCNRHLSVRGSAHVYGNLEVGEKVTFANGMEVTGTSIFGYVEASDISASRNIECTNLIASGDTSSGSDIRFKDIIENKTIKIEDIANAPLFTFKWNDRNDDGIHLGSSAQYWEAITPELVCGTDFKHLNYAGLGVAMGISLANKALNHEERIKMLEQENKALKEEIRRIRYVE